MSEVEVPKHRINNYKEVEDEMAINYAAESQRLNAFVPEGSSQFWKPKPGQYTIKFLSEVEDAENFKDDPLKPQAKVSILVNDTPFVWTVGKGKSSASSYGQLVNFALASGGSIKDKTAMVVVIAAKGKDNKEKNNYTIVKL